LGKLFFNLFFNRHNFLSLFNYSHRKNIVKCSRPSCDTLIHAVVNESMLKQAVGYLPKKYAGHTFMADESSAVLGRELAPSASAQQPAAITKSDSSLFARPSSASIQTGTSGSTKFSAAKAVEAAQPEFSETAQMSIKAQGANADLKNIASEFELGPGAADSSLGDIYASLTHD
jgi:hypothetical protein